MTLTMTDANGTSYTRPYASLLAAWGNDHDDGFDPGPESERGRLIHAAEVSVYNSDDGVLLVGDNGDWAVWLDWQQVEAL